MIIKPFLITKIGYIFPHHQKNTLKLLKLCIIRNNKSFIRQMLKLIDC